LRAMRKFDRRYPGLNLELLYRAKPWSNEYNLKVRIFIDKINGVREEKLTSDLLRPLFKAYFDKDRPCAVETFQEVLGWVIAACQLEQSLDAVPVGAAKNFLNLKLNEALDAFKQQDLDDNLSSLKDLETEIENLKVFFNVVVKDPLLTTDELIYLYTQWLAAQHQKQPLVDAVALLQRCRGLEKSYNGLDLQKKYCEFNPWDNQLFLVLLESIEDLPEEKLLNAAALSPLVDAYLYYRIENPKDLKDSLNILVTACRLAGANDQNEAIKKYFTQPENRKLLMKHLHYGLIQLGEPFEDQCYTAYQRLALGREDSSLAHSERSPRAASWQKRQHQLLTITEEISEIIKHPYNFLNCDVGPTREYKQSDLGNQQYVFKDKQDLYAAHRKIGFKSTNIERREQAHRLFSTLNKIDVNMKPADFYMANLHAIDTVQKEILDQDKTKFWLNRKGHSRLLDITVEMFVKVASDFLADPRISFEDQSPLRDMLNQQLKNTLEVLQARWPKPTWPNKQAILPQVLKMIEDAKGGKNLAEVEKALQYFRDEKNRKQIPKYLHYLFDHLSCFVELGVKSVHPVRPESKDP
ncbi:MAG TPA: hypothetical protein VLH77_04530, partial [Gammaproteobacteria bacterium]|nr:hypothetical protein [Gammaproteobacteria bacterium]